MNETIVARIVRAYGLDTERILPPEKGYRNNSFPVLLSDGRMVNLIFYKREPGILHKIRSAHAVADYLAQHNFPTRRTLSSNIAQLRSGNLVRYAALYNYLPGHTIPWEAYTMGHIKLLGQTMSDMHWQLAQLEQTASLPRVTDEYRQIIERMERYFTDRPVADALQRKLGLSLPKELFTHYRRILTACTRLPAQQPLHMDFVRSNILFGDTSEVSITGIIDFEKVAYGHPLFDIARTLSFLLVDCKYKPAHKVRKYFLHSGYNKRGARPFRNHVLLLKDKRVNLLETLIDLFLLYDLYKFLRHNPYESLPENKHFMRTKNPLVARNIIHQSARQLV